MKSKSIVVNKINGQVLAILQIIEDFAVCLPLKDIMEMYS